MISPRRQDRTVGTDTLTALALALALALAVAGCSQKSPTDTAAPDAPLQVTTDYPRSAPGARTSALPAPRTTARPITSTTTTAAVHPTQPVSSNSVSAPRPATSVPPECRAAALSLTEPTTTSRGTLTPDPQLDATFYLAWDLDLTNESATACSLDGWAGITGRGEGIIFAACLPPATPPGSTKTIAPTPCPTDPHPDHTTPLTLQMINYLVPIPVTLPPGGRTTFSIVRPLVVSDGGPYSIDVRVPHDNTPLTLALPGIRTGVRPSDADYITPFGVPAPPDH